MLTNQLLYQLSYISEARYSNNKSIFSGELRAIFVAING
jgi:hypothetical protein